jgi:hypothetical protein
MVQYVVKAPFTLVLSELTLFPTEMASRTLDSGADHDPCSGG